MAVGLAIPPFGPPSSGLGPGICVLGPCCCVCACRSSAGSGGQSAGGLQFDLDVIGHSSDVHFATILDTGARGVFLVSAFTLLMVLPWPRGPTDDAPLLLILLVRAVQPAIRNGKHCWFDAPLVDCHLSLHECVPPLLPYAFEASECFFIETPLTELGWWSGFCLYVLANHLAGASFVFDRCGVDKHIDLGWLEAGFRAPLYLGWS